MIRIIACVCLGVCLAGSALVRSQENKPNLTGRWVMNTKLTKWNFLPGDSRKPRSTILWREPRSAVEIIDHKEPEMTITRNVIEVDDPEKEPVSRILTKLTTDGNETVNHKDGTEVRVTSHWDLGKLIINTESEDKKFTPSVEVRSLSRDGKTMTIEVYMLKIEGDPSLIQVFERTDK